MDQRKGRWSRTDRRSPRGRGPECASMRSGSFGSTPYTRRIGMAPDQVYALELLRSHPGKWIRPANNVRLLAYLTLAVRGCAVATEDECGFRFQLAEASHKPCPNTDAFQNGGSKP